MLERFGAPDATGLKAQVRTLVETGQGPDSNPAMPGRASRVAVRLALRQLKAANHGSAALARWLAVYDRADEDPVEDDTLTLGH